MGCSASQTQVSDTCIDLLKAPSVLVFLEFKQPGQQELETGGEGRLPKPACHTWHVEIHGEGQVRWCQVHDRGIQSRRAESLGMGVGGKGTCLRGAWGKYGPRGKVPECAGQEGTTLLSFHVTKNSSEERGNSSRPFFFKQSPDIKP